MDDHGPSAVIACLNAIRVNDPEAVAAAVPPNVPVEDFRAASNRRFDDGRTLVETLARWGPSSPSTCRFSLTAVSPTLSFA